MTMDAQAGEPQVFERILCGVDGMPATLVAVRQALRLQDERGSVVLSTVANLAQAAQAGDATCSVLVARPARDAEAWPQAIAVGVPGSAESASAVTVARSISDRFGGSVRALASAKDHLDREAAQAIAPELAEHAEPAVDILVAASESADLVVVGSRGLHGLKALGSVSERVAHQARSAALVVRPGHK